MPLDAHDAPLPAADFEDFHINYQWRRLLAPLATRLLNRNIYSGTEIEIDTAVQQAHALIADLYPLVAILAISHAMLMDEKATGVHGGTSVAGWNARDLNFEVTDPDSIVTLASNKFIPVAGTYIAFVFVSALAATSNSLMRARLRNVTTAAIVGASNSNVYVASGSAQLPFLSIFTANGTDEYQIDTYDSVGRLTTGLGFAVSDGSGERYATLLLLRMS